MYLFGLQTRPARLKIIRQGEKIYLKRGRGGGNDRNALYITLSAPDTIILFLKLFQSRSNDVLNKSNNRDYSFFALLFISYHLIEVP